MVNHERVVVFIGSGEASLLERKVLIYSLRKHTQRDLDIYVFNGTHNAVELNDGKPFLAPMSLRVKYRNVTEFSNYRFLIPEINTYHGKAIWLDSDMVCLSDIGELFDTPMRGCDFLAKRNAYTDQGWGLSVLLIDCEKCRFDLEVFFDEIDQNLYTYTDLHEMRPPFLSCHPYAIGEIDPHWNVFDRHDANTKLIHYTDLYAQPWKFPNHPYGGLWFRYFSEARASGYISHRDIELSRIRFHVRRDLLEGNASSAPQPRRSNFVGRGMRFIKKRLNQTGLTGRSV